ncbi:hypothetical protein [Streptomyces solincola]|uniref:hypothetical protein n=1 Tax=Streptomyces solincola TaxID=2100817 RepID=UPI00215986F1|nr:hypothetical protein [Streptomyces solincola]
MTARTHHGIPTAPAPRAAAAPTVRLPWWAALLPVLVFGVLLTLATTGGGSAADGRPEVGQVLQHLRQTLAG